MAKDSAQYVETVFDIVPISKTEKEYKQLHLIQMKAIPQTGTYIIDFIEKKIYLINAIIHSDMDIYAMAEQSAEYNDAIPVIFPLNDAS